MAIQKNVKKAAPEAPEAEDKKATAAKKPATAKAAPKEDAAPKKEAPKAAEPAPEVENTKAEKVGRKEIAALIREKVAATGAAISPKVAEIAVVAYEEAVQELLAGGKQIALPGFGVFSVTAKAESVRPNPQKKGETITIAAHNAPKFKPGAKLKAAVNGGVETEDAETEDAE